MNQVQHRDLEKMEKIGVVMTNFDMEIDQEIAAKLKEDVNYFAGYAGWNFYACIVWEDNHYVAFVQQYHSLVATIKAKTLQEIMSECCKRFGHD